MKYLYAIFIGAVLGLLLGVVSVYAAPHGKPASPAQLVAAGLKKHRHRSSGRCQNGAGHWIRGCQ